MTPERWQRLKEICNLALECEPAERDSFVANTCGADQELLREAKSMIARATSGGGVLDGPIWRDFALGDESVEVTTQTPSIPETVGRYRILRVIGEGGMGVVYEAQQEHPRRWVALKVIRPGLASAQMLRRFDRESQALARLHHVGIAQIFEAGTAETVYGSQPYFAMEFIQGTPLRLYADAHHLGTRERLDIMSKICAAVEHAHQNGIIHRDLKPGNILVDETGQPKILDFGVARLTDCDPQVTKETEIGQPVGTLAYMSPEQVLGDPAQLDSRSDVYALGVVIYELLAQRLPYDVSDHLYDAVRTIRDEDPKRLSSISRAFRGDVENIVAKALEKDKARRYPSAAAMQGDIRRYLADEPITARPASAAYQLRKFVQRHKTLVGATAIVFVVLIAGIIVSTREAVKARRAEQISVAVNDFLQNDLLAQASSRVQASTDAKPDPDLKVRTALDRAAARITGKFNGQPEVEAAIRDTIGRTYTELGLYPEAGKQLQRALELQQKILGTRDSKTLRTTSVLGSTLLLEGKFSEAEALLSNSLELQRRELGLEHPDVLYSMHSLARVYYEQGNYAKAETLYRQTLEIRRRILGSEHPDTLSSLFNLAIVYYLEGNYAQAEPLFSQAVASDRRVLGHSHPDTLNAMNGLASVYDSEGKYAQADSLYGETLGLQRNALGPEHPDTLATMANLAYVYVEEGSYTQAEALYDKTLELQRRKLGAEHPDTLYSMENLANVYIEEGKYGPAEALLKRTLDSKSRVLGSEHPNTLSTLSVIAALHQRQGNYALAENYASQVLAARRRISGSARPDTMQTANQLALAYISDGKYAASEPLAREALEFYEKNQPDDVQRFRGESLLGASLAGQKKYIEAEPLLVGGYLGLIARKDRIDIPDQYHLDLARKWVVQLYQAWGKPEKVAEWKKK
jgi:tetratricopeptide (TPR) repeat protein/predicted Ser/Thr protein kinase